MDECISKHGVWKRLDEETKNHYGAVNDGLCVACWYCTENHLRKSRYPQADCLEKLKAYFRSMR